MSWYFNILATATDSVKTMWKACLNLCSQTWLESSLNLANNFTPLILWQLKVLFSERRTNFKNFFLKMLKLPKFRIFCFSLFHSITTEEKKKTLKEVMFYFEVRNVVHCVKSVQIQRYFCPAFSCIWNRNKSVFGHILRSGKYFLCCIN